MEFFDVIENRHSVRAYTDKPIPEDALIRILEAARKAPSASNKQPWKLSQPLGRIRGYGYLPCILYRLSNC